MNTLFRLQTALLALALLGGCAQYEWQKYGASQQDFNRDSYGCQIEAARTFPAAIVTEQISAGYTTASTTNCYGNGSATGFGNTVYGSSSTNCITTPGSTVPPISYTSDANQSNREQANQACMRARGWELVQVGSGQQTRPAQVKPVVSRSTCASDSGCPSGMSCRFNSDYSGTECRYQGQ